MQIFEDGIEPIARSNREVFGAFLRDHGGQDLAIADIELDLAIEVAVNAPRDVALKPVAALYARRLARRRERGANPRLHHE